MVAIKRQKDFGSLHVGPLTVIPFHGMARMTRSRSLLASILGGFVSSDRWRAGPSSRLDNDDPAAPFPQIPYLSTTSTPFATHDERPCFPGPRLPFPLFFSTISLSLSLFPPHFFLRYIATTHRHSPSSTTQRGVGENCAEDRSISLELQQPHNRAQIGSRRAPDRDLHVSLTETLAPPVHVL